MFGTSQPETSKHRGMFITFEKGSAKHRGIFATFPPETIKHRGMFGTFPPGTPKHTPMFGKKDGITVKPRARFITFAPIFNSNPDEFDPNNPSIGRRTGRNGF